MRSIYMKALTGKIIVISSESSFSLYNHFRVEVTELWFNGKNAVLMKARVIYLT